MSCWAHQASGPSPWPYSGPGPSGSGKGRSNLMYVFCERVPAAAWTSPAAGVVRPDADLDGADFRGFSAKDRVCTFEDGFDDGMFADDDDEALGGFMEVWSSVACGASPSNLGRSALDILIPCRAPWPHLLRPKYAHGLQAGWEWPQVSPIRPGPEAAGRGRGAQGVRVARLARRKPLSSHLRTV